MIEILRDMKYIKKCQNLTIAWFHFRKLVNVLSETPESQKEDLPYEQSRLTHVLKDTLGGNSRVTFLCSISSEHRYFLFLHFFLRLQDSVVCWLVLGKCRCRSGTLSTLRFGERAKLLPNKAVINEISEDDVNGLSDQIRQLKVLLQRHIEVENFYGFTNSC